MAELPDIDTGQVAVLSYWHVEEDGGYAGEISPTEVTSDGDVVQYTAYDNGIQGDYQFGNGQVGKFRVKSEGWFIAWMPSVEDNLDRMTKEEPRGKWDFVRGWESGQLNDNDNISDTELSTAIGSLVSNLSNSSQITFDFQDVSTYAYEWDPDAVTLLHTTTGNNRTCGFQYTEGTTLHYIVGVAMTSHYYSSSYGSDDSEVNFEGQTISKTTGDDENGDYIELDGSDRNYGAMDLSNIAVSANTEYQANLIDLNGSGQTRSFTGIVAWS
jgi:hypothetical protein